MSYSALQMHFLMNCPGFRAIHLVSVKSLIIALLAVSFGG